MAFLRVNCRACGHAFYRVEVRCGDYPAAYDCPNCNSNKTIKQLLTPEKGEKAAEANACCREQKTAKKTGCGSCSGCGKH